MRRYRNKCGNKQHLGRLPDPIRVRWDQGRWRKQVRHHRRHRRHRRHHTQPTSCQSPVAAGSLNGAGRDSRNPRREGYTHAACRAVSASVSPNCNWSTLYACVGRGSASRKASGGSENRNPASAVERPGGLPPGALRRRSSRHAGDSGTPVHRSESVGGVVSAGTFPTVGSRFRIRIPSPAFDAVP